MMENKTVTTYEIPMINWGRFEEALKRINKRAKKLDCSPITWTEVDRKQKTLSFTVGSGWEARTISRKCDVRVIELCGDNPMLGDWCIEGRIEASPEGNYVFGRPGGPEWPEHFRSCDATACEHCSKRRRRIKVYVLRHVTNGKWIQVGRTCLKDFTGADSPERAAGMLEWLRAIKDEIDDLGGFSSGPGLPTLYPVDDVLAATALMIRVFGWMSKGKANETSWLPTAYRVMDYLAPRNSTTPKWLREMIEDHTDKDAAMAAATAEWVRSDLMTRDKLSDYEHNLALSFRNEIVEANKLGIVCSAVSAYYRHLERQEDLIKRQENAAVVEYLGALKQRLKGLHGRVTMVRSFEGDYGPTTMIKIQMDEAMLTWFASGDRTDLTPGQDISFDATIKGHKEYQGTHETQVTRVTIH